LSQGAAAAYNCGMRTLVIQGLLVMSASLTSIACGGGQAKAEAPATIATEAPPPVPEGHPECVDARDKPIRCSEDSECCTGFVCGRDPELNPAQKYCIFGG
jgi:Ion channel inhibitory toxin/Dickkopf N-terminal cysteine-rich region